MEDYTKNYIKEEDISNIVSVLMDIGDMFPESKEGMFDFDTSLRILRIFRQLSLRFETQEERFNIFKSAIEEASNSIYTVVHKVAVLGQEHGKLTDKTEGQLKSMQEREVNAEQLSILEGLVDEKISSWATAGKLDRHKNLASILYSWQRWNINTQDVSKKFVSELIETDGGLVNFITSFSSISTSHTAGDHVSRKNLRINLKNVGDFVFNTSSFHEFDDNQQKAIKVFLDTYDGKVDDW